MPVADLGEVRLSYEISGEGPPLVLVPGWTLNLHMWDLVIPALERFYRVIRYDVRGAGASSHSRDAEYSRVADSEDLLGLLDHLGIEKAHLVGHSKGARIVLTFSMRWPGRVLTASAIGSAEPHGALEDATPFRPIAHAWVARVRDVAAEEGAEAAVAYLSKARLFGKLRTTVEGVRLLRMAMEGYEAPDLLSTVPARSFDTALHVNALTMPVLFLCGEEDPFLPECRFAHAQIQTSRLVVLPKCGHMAPLERPSAVAQALLDFLERDGVNRRDTDAQRKE